MTEYAVFGMGCFWGAEEVFIDVSGVVVTRVGFMGGTAPKPTYEQVCGGRTGHAEVVQVEYDPDVVSYAELLRIFWDNHDPTTLNRQGPDIGDQYRSAIFYRSPEQREAAEASMHEIGLSERYTTSIATELTAAGPFFEAEDYHQQYFRKRGGGACALGG